jgi:hypothetical protein
MGHSIFNMGSTLDLHLKVIGLFYLIYFAHTELQRDFLLEIVYRAYCWHQKAFCESAFKFHLTRGGLVPFFWSTMHIFDIYILYNNTRGTAMPLIGFISHSLVSHYCRMDG